MSDSKQARPRGFTSDNIAGASPAVIAAITECASGQALPYGNDELTHTVERRLAEVFEHEVDVFLVSTGSAANALALAAMTPPWGSVLSHAEAHINRDECGAPEFYTAGAKLVQLPGDAGKIDIDALAANAKRMLGDVHSVQPSSVSITQATEVGSVYGSMRSRRSAISADRRTCHFTWTAPASPMPSSLSAARRPR
uniref:Probable L-threonine aldolase n=1 Tax=Rhizobium loti TaxID=381 RepID=M5ALY9_RHILI|nr:beta-eliminating lyase-related protein [Mesorhizobium jarvisii]BAN09839.1 probable L-threonine aldolase [Mesorhizobium loti NZP2037]